MAIVLHLVKYVQDAFKFKHRKLMLFIIFTLCTTRVTFHSIK
jgi:hypothetical protein